MLRFLKLQVLDAQKQWLTYYFGKAESLEVSFSEFFVLIKGAHEKFLAAWIFSSRADFFSIFLLHYAKSILLNLIPTTPNLMKS